jgi:Flp pilus assembly protein TadD
MSSKGFHLFIIIACAVSLSMSCSKTRDEADNAVLQEHFTLSEKAAINQEIKKLHESLKSAKDDYERARIYENIASLEIEKGDVGGALRTVNQAIKFQPNLARAHYLRGMAYLQSNRYDEAEFELLTAIQLDDKMAAAHFELGNLHYKKGALNKAVGEYQLAVKFDKNHYQAWNNLGVIYFMLKKSKEAETALKKVSELKPGYASVYKNLGVLYDVRLGNKTDAVANYKKYLKLRPNAPERKIVKIWIAGLGG